LLSAGFDNEVISCPNCGSAMLVDVNDLLGEDNLMGRETRPLQLQMATLVEKAVVAARQAKHDAKAENDIYIIEGGTGVGKTLAYLAPALVGKQRTLISTANKALQDQIVNEDGPMILDVLRQVGHHAKLAVYRGKSNYLCLALVSSRQQVWPHETQLVAAVSNPPAWAQDATVTSCIGLSCAHAKDCQYLADRQKVVDADVVVVNHYAIAAEFNLYRSSRDPERMKNKLFGPRDIVIFDEAHTLHDIFSGALSDDMTVSRLKRISDDTEDVASETALKAAVKLLSHLFDDAHSEGLCVPRAKDGPTQYVLSDRSLSLADLVAEHLSEALTCVEREIACIEQSSEMRNREASAFDDMCRYTKLKQRIVSALSIFKATAFPDTYCVWMSYRYNTTQRTYEPILNKKPITVYHALKDFWENTNAVLISATISNVGQGGEREFSKFKRMLGITDVDPSNELIVNSPFDYRRKSVLYLESDMALLKPKHNASSEELARWYARMSEEIGYWVTVSRGNAMVLCASTQDMEELEWRCRALNDFDECEIISQSTTANTQLVTEFLAASARTRSRDDLPDAWRYGPVMFGLRSIWEGVSIPGDALTQVIIPRIPFANNTDPVFKQREAAFTAYLASQGVPESEIRRLAFNELQLYDTGIQMRQGVGRLIRTQYDAGLVTILDPRLLKYGQMRPVLNELPMFFAGKNTTDNKARATKWYTNHLMPKEPPT